MSLAMTIDSAVGGPAPALRELTPEEVNLVGAGNVWIDVALIGLASVVIGAVAVAVAPAAGALLGGVAVAGWTAAVASYVFATVGGFAIAMGSGLFYYGTQNYFSGGS